MSCPCTKCGHDPRSDFPIGAHVRYWSRLCKVTGHSPRRIRIRSLRGSFGSCVEPSGLMLVGDNSDIYCEDTNTTRTIYWSWRAVVPQQCDQETEKLDSSDLETKK